MVTDHHALCWLASLKDPSGRLGRWALRLQEFDIAVQYKCGCKHADADALSRCPLPVSEDTLILHEDVVVLTPFDANSFILEQLKDPEASLLIHHLDGSYHSLDRKFVHKCAHFALRDGMLYRKNYSSEGARYLLFILSHLRKDVLVSLHDDPTAGHLGFFKTYERVRRRYFWPRLYTSVFKYVSSCVECQRRKSPTSTPTGLLQPILSPRQPFERVGIDLFGPLPISTRSNRCMVVAIGHVTRFVIAATLPTGSSAEIANFFIRDILLQHGAPWVLLSDRRRPFLAQLLQEILTVCSVVHKFPSGYHP